MKKIAQVARTAAALSILASLMPCLVASGAVLCVDWAGDGDYETIQAALDAATTGDTVLVAPGVYTGPLNRNLDPSGSDVVIRSEVGSEWTIIDCTQQGRAFHFHTGESPSSMVAGFTIMNGQATQGAAVLCDGASPTISRCSFVSNVATGSSDSDCGGGVRLLNSSATITECAFIGNEADNGGGLACRSSVAVVERSYFSGNRAALSGGAVLCDDGAVQLVDSQFFDNEADAGGALLAVDGHVTAEHCLLVGNVAIWGAAVCVVIDAEVLMTGCTVVQNRATASGPRGAVSVSRCTATIEESILAFNEGLAVVCEHPSYDLVEHSCVFANTDGDSLCSSHWSNIFTDPLFCDIAARDYRLCANSACLPWVNPWDMSIGVHGQGCDVCDSAVRQVSWAAVKALYRR